MKKQIIVGLSLFVIGVITACSNAKEMNEEISIREFNLNDTISMHPNSMFICVDDPSLFVKLDSIGKDSRCPENADCIWEGNAEVYLGITHKKELESITLNTSQKLGTSKEAFGYNFELVSLSPYPGSKEAETNPAKSIKLKVSKK